MKKIIILLFVVIFLPLTTFAATIQWTGAVSTSWHDAGNWSTNTVPFTNDDVQIFGTPTANQIDILISAFCKSLIVDSMTVSIGGNTILTVNDFVPGEQGSCIFQNHSNVTVFSGNIDIKGTLILKDYSVISNSGGIILDGDLPFSFVHINMENNSEILNNSGSFINGSNNIEPGSNTHKSAFILMNNSCVINNFGILDLSYNATTDDYVDNGIIVNNMSNVFNAGSISLRQVKDFGFEIQNGALGTPFSELENFGNITIDGCVSCGGGGVGIGVGQHGKFFDNPSSPPTYGLQFNNITTNIWNTSCIVYNAPPSAPFSLLNVNFLPTSVLSGNGPTMNQSAMMQGGISPGFSPGVITFLDPFSVVGSTEFTMELAGTDGAGNTTGHDQIVFASSMNDLTDVSLKVEFIDGFVPSVGDMFTIVDGSYTGTFMEVNFPGSNDSWTIHYNTTDITIELTSSVANLFNIGIGTSDPATKLQIEGGDLYISNPSHSIILKDPNGNCRRLTVDASGVITAPIVNCPQ